MQSDTHFGRAVVEAITMEHMFASNKLPLRHVFRLLNGVTTGPYGFSGKLER